jgi:hypothetical protein
LPSVVAAQPVAGGLGVAADPDGLRFCRRLRRRQLAPAAAYDIGSLRRRQLAISQLALSVGGTQRGRGRGRRGSGHCLRRRPAAHYIVALQNQCRNAA